MSWFQRLKKGLSRTSDQLTSGISDVVAGRPLDDEALEELEDLLIMADLGPTVAAELTANLAKSKRGKTVTDVEVREALAEDIERILERVAEKIDLSGDKKPFVMLVVGVNGTGKTTTIGKLAHALVADGASVMIAAGDTFRAAAIEQLQVWGERAGVPVIAGAPGADPAGLAFDALERARAEGVDVLMIDTAGRLHNKSNLMDELKKIRRVLKKVDLSTPHETLLTLDATTGQNAYAQVKAFTEIADVSGLVLTKLDGAAKGGVLVGLARAFDIPVRLIGVGEGAEDLRPFEARDFARNLLGLE